MQHIIEIEFLSGQLSIPCKMLIFVQQEFCSFGNYCGNFNVGLITVFAIKNCFICDKTVLKHFFRIFLVCFLLGSDLSNYSD